MQNNIRENIVLPAWKIINENISIKRFYFLPWLLSIIFLSVLLVYQSIYTYVKIMWKEEMALEKILEFLHSEYLWYIVSIFLILIIFYIFISPIFEAWLIKYIDSKHKWEELSIWDCVWVWMYRFLPLFEYNNIFSEFKLISILNAYLFLLRFIWIEYIKQLTYVFLIIFLLSILINILFAYSKYEIILQNKNAFQALGNSSKIAIINLFTTIKLYLLMFLFNIRVIINFFVFLTFPVLMVLALTFITSKLFLFLAMTIVWILFFVLLIIVWYLSAVIDVFKASIWYFAYMQWIKKLKIIEESSQAK